MSLNTSHASMPSAQQRRCNILLMLFTPFSAVQPQTICQVNGCSLQTAEQDLLTLQQRVAKLYQLHLSYHPETGYQIEGEILQQRICLFYLLRLMLRINQQFVYQRLPNWLYHCQETNTELNRLIEPLFEQSAIRLGRDYSEHDWQLLQLYLPYCLNDYPQLAVEFSEHQQQWLRGRSEFQVANWLFDQLQNAFSHQLPLAERDFLTLLLRLLKPHSYESCGSLEDETLQQQIALLIDNFQQQSGMLFSNNTNLQRHLFAHLGPAIERCYFSIGIDNVLPEDIIQMYPRLVRLTQEALQELQIHYQVSFSWEEVSLIAINFGAWLMRANALQEKQILLLTNQNPQLEQAIEQQIREATLLPLQIKYQSINEFHSRGAPNGITMIVTPYATQHTMADPLIIHTQLPLEKEQRKKIRSLLEAP